jgi:hypothetical protein
VARDELRLRFLIFGAGLAGIAALPLAFDASDPLDEDRLGPSDRICSLVAERTSVALTWAPRRRAVAIACRPATPTPMTKTFAALTVPAAVIIIGKPRP